MSVITTWNIVYKTHFAIKRNKGVFKCFMKVNFIKRGKITVIMRSYWHRCLKCAHNYRDKKKEKFSSLYHFMSEMKSNKAFKIAITLLRCKNWQVKYHINAVTLGGTGTAMHILHTFEIGAFEIVQSCTVNGL